ncbi:hypothetical protein [Ancylobacter radicis]|uniref:Uncharacterized protein n=1 Tax=Ancylobacter radicis TaxID=2836179 RepID=A0ABS5RAM0_9HYPH|nr:hypothetical protein [Ancylobacter radicis]MBS9478721.1 hypothetical protein [Ancylobacter radicis]
MVVYVEGRIDLHVTDVLQLFDMMDPYPFRERDIAGEVDEHIYDEAVDMPSTAPIAIFIHMPAAAADTEAARGLSVAFASFFAAQAERGSRELSQLLRLGRQALGVGLVVLALCVVIGQVLYNLLSGTTHIASFILEGFMILGWVANWRPMEIFLYDWWPIVQKRSLYRRLAAAPVTVVPYQVAPQA